MKQRLLTVLIVMIGLGLSGCINLPTKIPPQKTYMLTLHFKPVKRKPLTKKSLVVQQALAVAPYDNNQFIYRSSKVGFISDYYHLFLVEPMQQITDLTIHSIAANKIFNQVEKVSTLGDDDNYLLQPVIQALYADYRNSKYPLAVIQIRYILTNNSNQKVIMNQTFTAKMPLACKTNASLVLAWDRGMAKILKSLNQKLAVAIKR